MTAGTNIFDNKLNLNIGATFDPYSIDENGYRINKLNISNGGGLFRMTSANINLTYAIDSKSFNSDSKNENIEKFIKKIDYTFTTYYINTNTKFVQKI